MNDVVELPAKGKALAQVLHEHALRERMRTNERRTVWRLADHYFQGYRNFTMYDPHTGRLRASMLDEHGNAELQLNSMLFSINQVAGRLQAMDLRPVVERQGLGLNALRDRAVMQITMNSLINENRLRPIQEIMSWYLAAYGSVGVMAHTEDRGDLLRGDIELIHPRELMPFPSISTDLTQQRGIMREKLVPMSVLKRIYGEKVTRNKDDLEGYSMATGDVRPDIYGSIAEHYQTPARGVGYGSLSQGDETDTDYVWMRYLWTHDTSGRLLRYVAASGDYVFESVDYTKTNTDAYMPIAMCRAFNNGTFHGAGMFDLQFSMHRQAEQLLKRNISNVTNADRYGAVFMPATDIDIDRFTTPTEAADGFRMYLWEPDPTHDRHNITQLEPYNLRDVPGRTAMLVREFLGDVDPLPDLIENKGRADSYAALSFLDEQIQTSMSTIATSVQNGFSTVYRSMAQQAMSKIARRPAGVAEDRNNAERLVDGPYKIAIGDLSLDLAGAVINFDDGTMSFVENSLPSLDLLNFSVREANPRSELTRKAEVLDLYRNGPIMDPEGFILKGLEESLDFAIWDGDYAPAYQVAIENCLRIYNDSQEPKMFLQTPETAMPELQFRIVKSFMASPAMRYASPQVVNEFKKYLTFLTTTQQAVLSGPMPAPENVTPDALGMSAPQGPPAQGMGPSPI